MYGLDPINFGVVMALAKECWPYLVGILLVTILIAFVPEISTWLPTLLMGKGS